MMAQYILVISYVLKIWYLADMLQKKRVENYDGDFGNKNKKEILDSLHFTSSLLSATTDF